MPTFTSSAMNPNGSYVADGMDASDAANFNLQNQRQQQSIMAQLALAQLRSGDARYAAERSDNMGMAGINALSSINGQNIGHQDRMAELQATANRDKAQFGYMQGRDTMADKRHQQEWEYGTDPTKNPMLADQQSMNKSQTQLALAQLQELQDRQGRAKVAQNSGVPYVAKTEAGRTAAQSLGLSGSGLGEQALAAKSADIPELQNSADTAAQGVGADLDVLERKAASFKPWKSIDSGDISAVKDKLTQLIQQYTDAGIRPADAKLKAQTLLRQHMPESHVILNGDNPTTALYSALGIQGY